MVTDVDIGIIQKVKEAMGIDEELTAIELLGALKNYRKQSHPDKFAEENNKKIAEEKFKDLGELVVVLENYIEKQKLNLPATELLRQESLYDKVFLERKLDDALDKIKSLEDEIISLESKNNELHQAIERRRDELLENEVKELQELYKPSPNKIRSLGMAFLLTVSLAIMTKIESIYDVLKKYSPIQEHYLNSAIFILFVGMLLMVVKQWAESRLIIRRSEEVCSSLFCQQYLKHLSEKYEWEGRGPKLFTEADTFLFIQGGKSWWKRLLASSGFRVFQIGTYDKLKNLFINTLLNKKLIEIKNARNLDRVFIIVDEISHYYL